ncbi:uncharacterized protein LY89DRAFT_764148 [Mollisia scopiformis]|uniref:Apple domain-containing protein n=1 Tax=Mollisia scopiformis TaxID=149040 RepID=A0A132B964_MOLSC|nr:uncharacterized protein LY89DRAFT_764148 [Mollisia scopiformis]KUJ08793.1 hypothetical protein LY89DRAFT_764148 [Mollisia scopiformis]
MLVQFPALAVVFAIQALGLALPNIGERLPAALNLERRLSSKKRPGYPVNQPRSTPNTCNKLDALYLIFVAPVYSAKASSFCSPYIHHSTTLHATVTPTVTVSTTLTSTDATITSVITDSVTATQTTQTTTTFTEPNQKKRAATTTSFGALVSAFAASEISSVCSCLFTATTSSTTATSTAPATTLSKTSTDLVTASTSVTTFVTTTTTTTIPVETDFTTPTYCSSSSLNGGGTYGAIYIPQCGESYAGLTYSNGESSYYDTFPTYTACLQQCDNDDNCLYYSFFETETTDNCLLIDSPNINNRYLTPNPDPSVNSGYYEMPG